MVCVDVDGGRPVALMGTRGLRACGVYGCRRRGRAGTGAARGHAGRRACSGSRGRAGPAAHRHGGAWGKWQWRAGGTMMVKAR